MKIQMQLKDIIKDNELTNFLGLNPYCLNEGADPESWYVVDQDEFETWKKNKNIPQPTKENKWDAIVSYCESMKEYWRKGEFDEDDDVYLVDFLLKTVYGNGFWEWYNKVQK